MTPRNPTSRGQQSRLARVLRIIVPASILLGLIAYFGQFWGRATGPDHLLLITLDTTRADHLGCYGADSPMTPQLDSLAAAGALFEQAYTVAPLTLPAHVSLLTGRYPPETGVLRNGRERFDGDFPTLAEQLKSQGYETGAFVASFVLDKKFGLDRGFDHYDDRVAQGITNATVQGRRSGSQVVDAALAWLRKPRTAPTFCWVHFYDPHAPCGHHPDLFGQQYSENAYAAEIAYVDRQVGRLLAELRKQGAYRRTLVVVVGDHGEGLGEHDEKTHSLTLYNSTLRIPLIFHRPGRVPSGRRIQDHVSLVDVSPTILDLMGLSSAARAGNSFRSALDGAAPASSACYALTDEPFDVYGCAKLRSVIEGNWKYISSTRPELYDLRSDPLERQNLIEQAPDRAAGLAAKLAELEASWEWRQSAAVSLSGAELRSLAGLGYAAGASRGDTPASGEALPDIKDILPLERAMEAAVKQFGDGNADAAVQMLREIVARAPTHAPAVWSLAWALWSRSEQEEAMAAFRGLLVLRPDSATAQYGLGFMLLQREEYDSAIAELSKAVDLDPRYAEAHLHLAEALMASGQVEECRVHLNEVLMLEPGRSDAIQLLTFIELNRSRLPAAIQDYRRALRAATEASAKLPPSIQQFGQP